MTTTLAYPYTAPHSRTVVLPSPELGDTHSIDYKVVSHQTMSGAYRSYRRTGNRHTLLHNYLNIPAETLTAIRVGLLALITESAGSDIRITIDAPGLSQIWQAKIITINPRFVNRTRNYYELSLEYEGAQIG